MPHTLNYATVKSDPAERLKALELAIENLPVAVGLFDLEGHAFYLNEPFRKLYHVEQKWGLEFTFADLIASGALSDWRQDPREFFDNVRRTLKEKGSFDALNEVGDRIISVHDVLIGGNLILTTQFDVTDRVMAERRVTYLAHNDVLTDLPNRSAFNTRLDNLIAEKTATSGKFAVVSVDVDHFKDVNDIFGHAAGDRVLQEMAARFKRCMDPDDFVARLGGDEFIFLCASKGSATSVDTLAERLMVAAAEDIDYEGHSLKVGLSIGYAVFPDDGADKETLLGSADAALYRAKAEGRGTVRSFEPDMHKRIHEQRSLQHDLRFAVPRDELLLHYQPQATVGGSIYGFEALVRWQHPRKGLIHPDAFIPLAEESGLIVDIGEWVLDMACREAATWPDNFRLSVNLSPVQFRYGDLIAIVHGILMRTGMPAHRLELEVTEGVLVQDFARALHILRGLKALGIQVAMDDFGTGYSSLSYLQAFPFDTLKIDKSFILKLSKDGHADEIVRAVIGLGRGLNIPIVAEGVETDEQRSFLAREHCQNIQGHLVGKALPIEAYGDLLKTGRITPDAPARPIAKAKAAEG